MYTLTFDYLCESDVTNLVAKASEPSRCPAERLVTFGHYPTSNKCIENLAL